MSKNNLIIAALGGAVVAAVVANYLGTEKGKQLLNSASGLLTDLAGKATEYAKNSFTNFQSVGEDKA